MKRLDDSTLDAIAEAICGQGEGATARVKWATADKMRDELDDRGMIQGTAARWWSWARSTYVNVMRRPMQVGKGKLAHGG